MAFIGGAMLGFIGICAVLFGARQAGVDMKWLLGVGALAIGIRLAFMYMM